MSILTQIQPVRFHCLMLNCKNPLFANGTLNSNIQEIYPDLVYLLDSLELDTYENTVFNTSTTLNLGRQKIHTYSNSTDLFQNVSSQPSPEAIYQEVDYSKVTFNTSSIPVLHIPSPNTFEALQTTS